MQCTLSDHRRLTKFRPVRCVSAHSTKSTEQIKVETQARDLFSEHLKSSNGSSPSSTATGILQQAAQTKKVDPYLTLGAALSIEDQAPEDTGVLQAKQDTYQADKTDID